MASLMWLTFPLLLLATAAIMPIQGGANHLQICEAIQNASDDFALATTSEEFGAMESPPSQALLSGMTNLWGGLGLIRRQSNTVCSSVCKATTGTCCAGCVKNDGSTACGKVCCVVGNFCNSHTQCVANTYVVVGILLYFVDNSYAVLQQVLLQPSISQALTRLHLTLRTTTYRPSPGLLLVLPP